MPTYVYRREDGTTFEIEQRITEDALEVCPTTGQPVARVISGGTGLIFKGSGFYLTDYARNQNGADNAEKAKTNGKSESSGSESATSSVESKKADKSSSTE